MTEQSQADEFSIWQRLLLNVQNELSSDRDGIARNLAHIANLKETNEWLERRIAENVKAEKALSAKARGSISDVDDGR